MDADDYNLKWNNFEAGITSGMIEILESEELFDVTLVCSSKQLKAHKLVLSACSPVFRSIFNNSTQNHPIVYMRGISFHNLEAAVKFMYRGEVCVSQEKLSDFLSTAEDLRVKGLYQADKPQNSGHNKTPKTSSAAALKRSSTLSNSREFCGHNKRQKTESPILVDDRAEITDDSSHLAIKNESIGDVTSELEAVESEDYINDYDTNYDLMEEYSEDAILKEQPISYNSTTEFSSSTRSTTKIKPSRQPIVNFINLNKVKTDQGYMCGLCERMGSDNSNMNRHIEVKHADQLQLYLASQEEVVLP